MWMHFFWIFGHPEVYILVVPAFAFALKLSRCFRASPSFGYPVMVAATVGIGFVSFSVWAHHMFTVGMSAYGNTFFTVTSMIIGFPPGSRFSIGWEPCGAGRFSSRLLCCSASDSYSNS